MAKKKQEPKPREMTRRQLSSHKRQQRRQRLIFFSGVSVIAIIVIIVMVGVFVGEIIPLHRTVLQVNNRSFDLGYYIDALELSARNNPDKTVPIINAQLLGQIQQNELLRQGAESLGVTVTDKEVKDALKNLGLKVSEVNKDVMRAQLAREKLQEGYFGDMVPLSDKQVYLQTLFVGDADRAAEVRERLASGDNVTDLAREFGLNYYSRNKYMGDYGWHPAAIYTELLGTSVPIDYAFGAAAGDISGTLSDNESYKQQGYWLLNVVERNEDPYSVKLHGLLLSTLAEANDIRARLEAGEDLAALAAEYSDYSASRDTGGVIGTLTPGDKEGQVAISKAVDAYIFAGDTEIGVWSEPIFDTQYWTRGGYWVVKVVDTAEDRELSEEDRSTLIRKLYNDWFSALSSDPSFQIKNLLTNDQQARAINDVEKKLSVQR